MLTLAMVTQVRSGFVRTYLLLANCCQQHVWRRDAVSTGVHNNVADFHSFRCDAGWQGGFESCFYDRLKTCCAGRAGGNPDWPPQQGGDHQQGDRRQRGPHRGGHGGHAHGGRQVQVAGGLPRGRPRHLRHPHARPRRRAEGAGTCARGSQRMITLLSQGGIIVVREG